MYIEDGYTDYSKPLHHLIVAGDTQDIRQLQTRTNITGTTAEDFAYDTYTLTGMRIVSGILKLQSD